MWWKPCGKTVRSRPARASAGRMRFPGLPVLCDEGLEFAVGHLPVRLPAHDRGLQRVINLHEQLILQFTVFDEGPSLLAIAKPAPGPDGVASELELLDRLFGMAIIIGALDAGLLVCGIVVV